jgi:hypothetical protein
MKYAFEIASGDSGVFIMQNYWAFGIFSSYGVFRSRATTFRKLDLFPSSGKRGEDTQLGPLERAHLNKGHS